MEIRKADEMGFCFGVRRAIEVAKKAAKARGKVESLGSIVHNRQVVERLEEEGVKVSESLEGVEGRVVAITSHGIGPQVLERAMAEGLEIIDTTCPFVRKAQRVAKRLAEEGFTIVIFGDSEHPEVRGVLEWAGGKAIVTQNWETLLALKRPPRKLALLSQTTQSVVHFTEFVQKVTESYLGSLTELRVVNTICDATSRRQAAALKLAREVDLMLVVGGHDSANTRRLAELCAAQGVETHHIETAAELDSVWLRERQRVGVTAGASTPDWVVEEVLGRLQESDGQGS